MSTLILDKVLSGYNLAKVNDNFERIEKAFNEALLHRDGSKELLDDLDVNSQKLLNVGGIEIGGVDIVESIASLQEEYNAYISTMNEYKAAVDEILEEAISYGAVDQKSIGNAQRVFTTSQTYAVNSNMTLPLPYVVGKNTLKLNLGHYYELYKGVDYEEVGVVGSQSTTIKLLRTISSGVEIEEFVDGDNDLYSIYATAEALQELLTTSYSPESIEEFVNSVSDIQELGLEDKIAQLNSLYESLVSLQTDLQTTVADINTKYSTITDMYEDVGTKYSLLESLYPQLLVLIADTDFDLDGLNDAVGELNDAISDLNDLAPVIEEYKDDAETAATSAESSASSASTSATSAANSASSAAGALTNAQIWAEGTDGQVETLGGEHSSKGWAEQAKEYISEITSNSEIVATGSPESRTLADRFADVINVKDFGAKGDGVTDDTAAIQSALNKADGHVVLLPVGIYTINGGLSVAHSCQLTGTGAVIKQMTQASEYTMMVSSADVTIKDISFVNNSKQVGFASGASRQVDHCIKTTAGADNLTISGCSFEKFRGCVVPTTGNSGLIKNLTVENCVFEHYDYALLLDDFDGCSIVNCTGRNIDFTTYLLSDPASSNDPPHLLYVTDRSGTAKRNLRVVNCLEVGNIYSSSYKVRNTNGVTISNNVSDGCCRGVEIDQCWNVVVTGNSITNMVSTDSSIAGTDGQQSGIWLSDVKCSVVSGNFIDCSANGVSIYGIRIVRASGSTETVESQDILVDGNEIVSNMSVYAFTIALLKDSAIRNNSVISTNSSSNTYLCYLSGCDGVVVENGFCKGFPLSLRFVSFNDGTWDGETVQSQNNVAVTNTYTVPAGSNLICSFNGTGTNKADVRKGTEYIPERASVSLPALRSPTAEHTGIYCASTYLMVAVQNASNATANAMRFNWSAAGYPSIDAYGRVVPSSDNSFPLGREGYRWSNVYAANATIDNIGASSVTATGSTTARTLENRFSDVINVKDFGAKGDGVTDDSVSIQAAFTSLKGKGGIVFFPQGKYVVSNTLYVYGGTTVQGSGHNSISDADDANLGTQFITSGNGESARWTDIDGNDAADDTPLFVSCGNGVWYKDFHLAWSSWSIGLFFPCVKQCGFENISATGFTDAPVYLDATWSNRNTTLMALHPEVTPSSGMNEFCGRNFKLNGTGIGLKVQGTTRDGTGYTGSTWQWAYDGVSDVLFEHGRCSGISLDAWIYNNPMNGIRFVDVNPRSADRTQMIYFGNADRVSFFGCKGECDATDIDTAISQNIGRIDFTSNSKRISFFSCVFLRAPVYLNGTLQNAPGTLIPATIGYGQPPMIDEVQCFNADSTVSLSANSRGVMVTDGGFFTRVSGSGSVGTSQFPLSDAFSTNLTLGETIISDSLIKKSNNTGALNIQSGSNTNGGARLSLNGSEASSNASAFLVQARNANANKQLVGKADGTLTWNGQAIQTSSDERIKTSLSIVPDEVLDAWGDVNWGQFQYLEAVEKKGESARLHLGLIAQRVKSIFEAHGLDGCDYGVLCFEEWDDEFEEVKVIDSEAVVDELGCVIVPEESHTVSVKTRDAGNLWTVRYTEALSLEAAYQRRRADRIEARLKAIEELLKQKRF